MRGKQQQQQQQQQQQEEAAPQSTEEHVCGPAFHRRKDKELGIRDWTPVLALSVCAAQAAQHKVQGTNQTASPPRVARRGLTPVYPGNWLRTPRSTHEEEMVAERPSNTGSSNLYKQQP
ncbi:hypothetical protein VDGL01_00619 [Verticillium dahliae]